MSQSHVCYITILSFVILTITPFPLIKSDKVNCDKISKDSPWEDQNPIRPCHCITHIHPRQEPRKNRTETEIKEFHHLSIFSIRYDLDFQEAGDPCSVRLQQEWLVKGGDGSSGNSSGPVPLSEYSFNRIWYKRLCNFFSYLECIPRGEVRLKPKRHFEDSTKLLLKTRSSHESHRHPRGLPDSHNHLPPRHNSDYPKLQKTLMNNLISGEIQSHKFKTKLIFNDSGRDTNGMYTMRIGGRGPGKGRHKSGPGATRVDPSKLLGLQIAVPVDGYPLDGVCVCSYRDPEFPDRKRQDYGMDFVEDEAREDWCVAAPGNLCLRVYFKRNLWPGQSFEFSDHIGCPRLYQGYEYECIRWQKSYKIDPIHGDKPQGVPTATCERKHEDLEFLKEAEKVAKRGKIKQTRLKSKGTTEQNDNHIRMTNILIAICFSNLYTFLLFVS